MDVRNPELVDVLSEVQEAEARLDHREAEVGADGKKAGGGSKTGAAAFDALFLALRDAEESLEKWRKLVRRVVVCCSCFCSSS